MTPGRELGRLRHQGLFLRRLMMFRATCGYAIFSSEATLSAFLALPHLQYVCSRKNITLPLYP